MYIFFLINGIVHLVFPNGTSENLVGWKETAGIFGAAGSYFCDDTFNCGFNFLTVE